MFFCLVSSSASAQNPSIVRIDNLLEDLFDDPTNLEKNFALLEEQTRQGDLLGASTTLERILILDPSSKLARVLLSEVQFNLGNLTSAKTTLISLQDDNSTPAPMKARVDDILTAIEEAESPWQVRGSLSVNRGSAENPRGASASDTVLLSDVDIENDTNDRSEAFTDTIALTQFSYSLPTQDERTVEVAAVAYSRDYMFYDAGDMLSLQVSAEYKQQTAMQFAVGTKLSHVAVEGDTYSTSSTAYAQVGALVTPRLNLTAYGETTFNNNFNTAGRSNARDYNGEKNSATIAATTQVFQMPLKMAGKYTRNDPNADIYKTTSRSLSLSTSTSLLDVVASLSASREWKHYRFADTFISTTKREDTISTGTVLLTLPFDDFPIGQTNLTAKASYTTVESSLNNFDKDAGEFHIGMTVNTY